LEVLFQSLLLFSYHFAACKITAEGMKAISSFFSQDGIVLEELDLGLKKRKNISFQHQTGFNKLGDEGCVHLVEGLKKNKSLKKLSLGCISPNNISLLIIFRLWDHF